MKSSDSVPYYEYHARRFADSDLAVRNPGEVLPFLQELSPGARVLDLGCGSGFDLKYIRKAGMDGVGLDASEARLKIAATLNPDAPLLQKNFLFYTPAEGEWDGVWANRSLHHFSPEVCQRVIASLFRGLKRNGVLGVVVYEGTDGFQDRTGDLAGPSRWIQPWREKAISSMIEQSGFVIKRVGRKPQEPERGNMLPSLLILARKI
ncbi:MAG: methyltransferase domain-containing protein [Bdellovibrionales bacterium]|nr:methyltransferase domain-containing protein [Bdellovibrionales bacterium]